MQNLKTFIQQNDRFARHNGIELLDMSEGTARAKMTIQENHLNAAGTVHGGALFTLADFVLAAASNSHDRLAMAINASISFCKSASQGTLTAEAQEVSLHHKLATYTIHISDENADIIAVFQGTVYRKETLLSSLSNQKEP